MSNYQKKKCCDCGEDLFKGEYKFCSSCRVTIGIPLDTEVFGTPNTPKNPWEPKKG